MASLRLYFRSSGSRITDAAGTSDPFARWNPTSNELNDSGRSTPMLKSLAALAMLALLGASVVALPYISRVEAGETVALAKGNRSDARTDCSQQVWPNISSHCLRGDRAESEVRLITSVRP